MRGTLTIMLIKNKQIEKNKSFFISGKKIHIIELLVFSCVLFFFISTILLKEATNLDELWNYNIARNIAKGLIPYKDISLITTPLLPMIEAIILKITTNELLVFRIIESVLLSIIMLLTYNVFNKLGVKKVVSAIFVAVIIYIIKDDIFLDYNYFVLFLNLIILLIELKHIDGVKSKKSELLIGMLAGCAVCTKHTIGLAICAEIVIFPFFITKPKEQIKNVLFRIGGICIPILFMIGYLLITGAFSDFMSYTFLAISTFSNSIPYSDLLKSDNWVLKSLSVILPIVTIAIFAVLLLTREKYKENQNYKKLEMVFACGLPLLLIQYPIADSVHFLLSNFITIVLVLFVLYFLLKKVCNFIFKKIPNTKNIVNAIAIASLVFIIGYSIYYSSENFKKYLQADKQHNVMYYNNIIVPEYTISLYEKLKKFEEEYEQKGINVNILDSNAVAVHIPMDKYLKNYDMFNKGNFGKDGEEGIIEQIKKSSNQVYLIKRKQYQKNWQNPNLITDYIENNLKKIGEIDVYDVYGDT